MRFLSLFHRKTARPPVPQPLVPQPGDDRLRELIHAEAGHFLADIEWRYKQARDLLNEATAPVPAGVGGRQVTAEDFNTLRHQLTGYTVTDNMNAAGTATPGSIRWQSLHIVYGGVDYTITDGASALKYHSFVKPASGTSVALTSSDTKPVLGKDDLLVFINNSGTAVVAASDGSASLTPVVADGAVDNGGLATGAVSGAKIADSGIGANKLGTGAINLTTQFGSKVVANAAIADNAVQSLQLNTGAVTAGKIASSAINNANLFTAGVVDQNAVGTGAVSATKLNVLSHTLY